MGGSIARETGGGGEREDAENEDSVCDEGEERGNDGGDPEREGRFARGGAKDGRDVSHMVILAWFR